MVLPEANLPNSVLIWRQLCNKRSPRKIDSQIVFSREYDFSKTFSLTENQFSRKTYFYTIHPWRKNPAQQSTTRESFAQHRHFVGSSMARGAWPIELCRFQFLKNWDSDSLAVFSNLSWIWTTQVCTFLSNNFKIGAWKSPRWRGETHAVAQQNCGAFHALPDS